jgi:hypothetical protein
MKKKTCVIKAYKGFNRDMTCRMRICAPICPGIILRTGVM